MALCKVHFLLIQIQIQWSLQAIVQPILPINLIYRFDFPCQLFCVVAYVLRNAFTILLQEPKISEKLCHLRPQSVALYNSYTPEVGGHCDAPRTNSTD
jgi:hypothetical protein